MKKRALFLFVLIIILFIESCQRQLQSAESSPSLLKHRNPYFTNPVYSEMKLAQSLIEKGQFSQALPKLLAILDTGGSISEVHYFLGIVYQELGSPQNALHHFLRYLKDSPNGLYADNTREKIGNLLGITEVSLEKLITIDQYIQQLEQRLSSEPDNTDLLVHLAGWYWLNQQYEKAGTLYKTALEKNPELWSNPTISSRLERKPDGNIILLTPEEAILREAEKNPIVFFNVTSFRSGRGIGGWSGDVKHQIFNVSGQIRNRSKRTLYNVNIQITIYGFSGMVYETKNITVGTLVPGQVKPFSTQFTHFDNIENVDHYDYVAYYDE